MNTIDISTLITPCVLPVNNSESRIQLFVEDMLKSYPDQELKTLLVNSVLSFHDAYKRGLLKWVVTYSGGKDSTTVLIIALEIFKASRVLGWGPESIDVVFSDTLLELPPIITQVNSLLEYIQKFAIEHHLAITTHLVTPPIEKRFWYNILAKGYPPPHNRFRWCTDRLKIYPSESIIKSLSIESTTVLLTGVRYDESAARAGRLSAACSQGGECGQGVWLERSERLNTEYLAPIAEWRTCKVWDFLSWVAPSHGWPTTTLATLYGSESIRFGCWTCSLVKRDRATEAVVQQKEWEHLKPLIKMRETLISVGRSNNPDHRLFKANGSVGKLSLERRKFLYAEIKRTENEVGYSLIDEEEARQIEQFWESPECLQAIEVSDRVKVNLFNIECETK